MNDNLDPRDDLTDRLRALGQRPVDPAVKSEHLTAIAGTDWHRSTLGAAFASRVKLGAAVIAGFLLGTTGLATAGALGPLQPIAAKAVEAATPLDVPHGKKDKAQANEHKASKTSPDGAHGTARVTEGCVKAENGEYAINRGQYLKQERAKGEAALAAAKESRCGLPLSADEGDDAAEANDAAKTESDETKSDACVGSAKAAESSNKPACPDDATSDGKSADKAANGADNAKVPESTPVTPDPAADTSQGADHAEQNTPGPETTTETEAAPAS